MPRMGKAGIRRSMAVGIPAAGELIMDWGQAETYLDSLEERGCAAGTISAYRNSLNKFFLSLPEDKRIEPDSILNWRERLLGEGYTPRTVNSALSAVNSFLDYIGLRGYQLPQYIQLSEEPPQPELTRAEYLRLLSTARALNNERLYLMIKTFAVTGLTVQELPLMTVEAVQAGGISPPDGGAGLVRIPACLREELVRYIWRCGLRSGPVFVTRRGKQLSRTAVTGCIQRLARDAQVQAEKCNPRCLHKLYLTTREEIQDSFNPLIEQAHERLLEMEQKFVGWEEAASE